MSEQPMPSPGQVDVTESLIGFLRERRTRGIATYGRSLETFNGRNAIQDLREELVDAAQYVTQWLLEREQLRAEVERLRGENARLVKLLHDLTPTGSEFIDDPDNCAAWIRTALTSRCEAIVKSRCVISEMRARITELEAEATRPAMWTEGERDAD